MTNLTQFIEKYTGKYVDVDNAYGAQCWDLWSKYAQEVFGIPQSETNTTDGYARTVLTKKYLQSKKLQEVFERKDAMYTPVSGDVVFFDKCAYYSGSHVAIVVADRGAAVWAFSQNPNAAKLMELPKKSVLGYLHPKININIASTIADYPANANVIAGTYITAVEKLNVRDEPTTGGNVVATYCKGQTVNLEKWGRYQDGYVWGTYIATSGTRRYIAVGTSDGRDWYLTLKK